MAFYRRGNKREREMEKKDEERVDNHMQQVKEKKRTVKIRNTGFQLVMTSSVKLTNLMWNL